jgi:hypothetical protein
VTIDAGYFLDHLTVCLHCDKPGSEHGTGGWTFREGKPIHTTCVRQFDRDYDAKSGISYCEACHAEWDAEWDVVVRAKDNPKMCVECSEYFPMPVVHFDIAELARAADTNIESAEK